MKLFKLALFDLRRGIREEWIKLAFAFIVCVFQTVFLIAR